LEFTLQLHKEIYYLEGLKKKDLKSRFPTIEPAADAIGKGGTGGGKN